YFHIFCVTIYCFFFQAEDGIRDRNVTGVQTCALPISTARIINSSGVKLNPKLKSLTKLAPNITGMDMKKENSAAIGRSVPSKIPPTIVEPERDVPGIKNKN